MESRAKNYLAQQGWSCKESGVDHIAVEVCPLCGRNEFKFYMNVGGGARDGLWDCKVCGEQGSLYQLQLKLGQATAGITSIKDTAGSSQQPDAIPNMDVANKRLLSDPSYGDVLDYLVAERKFSLAIIQQMKLGVETFANKKWLIIPYFNKHGEAIYAKYRSVPPDKKEFRSSAGREAPLYNSVVIKHDMDDLLFVEGEADCLSCLSNGIQRVCGVPGANVHKAVWLNAVDEAKPKAIYILYDRDSVGQKAAGVLAARLGVLDRTYNIMLPEFARADDQDGKDINEWFAAGHTVEEFEELKKSARKFDVDGVKSTQEIINEIIEDIDNHGERRWDFDSPWKALNSKLGGVAFGEVVGIIAEGKIGKTTMAMNWLNYLCHAHSLPCLNLCLEMPQKALVRKWASSVTGTEDSPAKPLTKTALLESLEIARTMPADLLFGFTRTQRPDDVFELIRQAVRRYGVRVVVFDNLQFLVRSIEHSAQETSRISKMFKGLAMELNIAVILIVQPNRVKDGDIVGARNASGSAAIEKDVDAMLALHRKRVGEIKADEFDGFMETEITFEPQMLVKVDLTRYAPGGVCTLYMDGAISTVRDMGESERVVSTPAPMVGDAVDLHAPSYSNL